MEEHNERDDDTGFRLQDGGTGNHIHHFYFVKFRPSLVEIEKEEGDKQYHLMTVARLRIIEEIAQLKGEEGEINDKLSWFQCRKEYFTEYKLSQDYLLENSVPGTMGFLRLTEYIPSTRTLVQQRTQKTLINKGKMDIRYFQQVQEELMATKKSHGMTSFGTQELDVMIESMVQMVQHGNKKRADELKIYQELRNINETREMYIEPSTEPGPLQKWHYHRRLQGSNRDTEWKRSIKHIRNIRLDENQKIRKDRKGCTVRVSGLKEDLGLVRKKIGCLQKELEDVNLKRVEAYNRAYKLGEQMKELMIWKPCFNEYQSLMTYVKEVARKGDVTELKQLCDAQVDGFMRLWNDNKTFRDDYVGRRLPVSK